MPDQRANRREPILRAAAALIAERGVRGLRVEEVARAAGVSTGLLYHHFGSRTGLVRAALDFANAQAPSTALLQDRHPGSGYEAVTAALLAELDEQPSVRANNVVWNEAYASAVFEATLRPDIVRATQAWEAAVATGIRRGIADGSIRADVDPERAAALLTALIDGLSERWLSGATAVADARAALSAATARVLRAGS